MAKAWDYHVTDVIRTTLDENLRMVEDSVRFLKEAGREVVVDAEHFFDGCADNEEYSLKVVRVAAEAGADCIVLCDTNGGALPEADRPADGPVRRRGRLPHRHPLPQRLRPGRRQLRSSPSRTAPSTCRAR